MAISLTKTDAEKSIVIDLLKRLQLEVVIIVDRSGSMNKTDVEILSQGIFGFGKKPQLITRYQASTDFVKSIIEQILIHDPKPDLGTFSENNSSTYFTDCAIGSQEHRNFLATQPGGGTYLIPCLNKAWTAHNLRGSKSLVFVVLDGDCHDLSELKGWLKDTAQKLETPDEFHLIFVKIGEENLGNFFQEIENLEGAKHDIVSFYSLKQIQEEGIGKHLQKIFGK